MSLLNYNGREIHCKIVYYGPEGSGKTTNIKWIYRHTADQKLNVLHLPLQTEPSVSFEFLPLDIGEVRGFKTRLHLYTLPVARPLPLTSQKLVLRGVDGVVFVADSEAGRAEDNKSALKHIEHLLKEESLSLDQIPMVLQYNKRDLNAIEPLSSMRGQLNLYNHPDVQASALKGEGVFETLKTLSKMVITVLKGGKLK